MTNTQHTPGPWTYSENTRTIRGPQNHWLASMDSWDGAIDHAANARLIAACPEMLAALIDAAAMLDAIARGRWNWDGSTEGQARSIAKDARAAIAKATGQ